MKYTLLEFGDLHYFGADVMQFRLITLIVIFFVHFCNDARCETHCAIDENDANRISFIGDSPYLLRQPHSLVDLYRQIDMVEEKESLKESLKQQQKSIERRYDADEPDIEKRVHETDENCQKSKSLDLQTERFIVTYPIDLVPFFIYDMRFNRETIASTSETLHIFAMERIFGVNARTTGTHRVEPHCTEYMNFDGEADEEVETFINIAEPELADLNSEEMQNLGSYLVDRLKQRSTRHLALYYAHFYWRLRGDTRSAFKCLLRHLEGGEFFLAPANFQLGSLYIRVGKYHAAVEILESVTNEISDCAECYAALGDAYVLAGNLPGAVTAFYEAVSKTSASPTTAESCQMKIAFLRCVLKVLEVMEDQHSTLLSTIDYVNEFKDKTTRLKLLSVLIEANRATPETRLQAKLAYEHYMAGPVPHLNCYGVVQYRLFGMSPLLGFDDDGGAQRLHCVVDDLGAFNVSLLMRYRELLETAFKEKRVTLDEDSSATKSELFRDHLFKFIQASNAEMVEYAKKLEPYMGMEIDSPSRTARYPLDRQSGNLPKVQSPSANECRNLLNQDIVSDASNLFLSPDNKGYIVSDILTKYLALTGKELSPLPWHLPTCHKFAAATNTNWTDDTVFTEMKGVRKLLEQPWKVLPIGDERLMGRLLSLLTDAHMVDEFSNEDSRPRVFLGDIGQRIGTLLKYRIGADWISLNLAALYLRYLGLYKDAAICLRSAVQLERSAHRDVAYTQMAQLLIRLAGEKAIESDERTEMLNDANTLLRLVIDEDPNEPLPHFLLGVSTELNHNSSHNNLESNVTKENRSAKHYWDALAIEPDFEEARRAISRLKCVNGLTIESLAPSKRSIFIENPPICCWPNEQEVYCFKSKKQTKSSKGLEPTELCYTFQDHLDSGSEMRSTLVYFRCNAIYTGRSYRPPPYARLISPFLRSAEQLRSRIKQRLVKMIDEDNNDKSKKPRGIDETPVLPLDYGGYSEEWIRAHQAELPQPSEVELRQSIIVLNNETGPTVNVENSDANGLRDVGNDDKEYTKVNSETVDRGLEVNDEPTPLSPLPEFDAIVDVHRVFLYDVPKPEITPQPAEELVTSGKRFFPPPKFENLAEYCEAYKESERILEQPTSTYVSVTAKGMSIHGSFITTTVSVSSEEPLCPDVTHTISTTPRMARLLEVLDTLPAYRLRHHLKFYRPETALRDALQSLSESAGSNRRMQIGETASRLAQAMRASQIRGIDVDWTLSGASSLYWRVKGDAPNAIKCLRHSLRNSPDNMKAGFHNSALFVGGKALQISPNSVVAIHFTLANIYVSTGDFTNALAFYYSTLALQSKFDGAKDRIRAIHCKTAITT